MPTARDGLEMTDVKGKMIALLYFWPEKMLRPRSTQNAGRVRTSGGDIVMAAEK
jgi:hypothetical protein